MNWELIFEAFIIAVLGYMARNYKKDWDYRQVLKDAVRYGTQQSYDVIVKKNKKGGTFDKNVQDSAMRRAVSEIKIYMEKEGHYIKDTEIPPMVEEQIVRMKNGKST
jgi:hypothetical protein